VFLSRARTHAQPINNKKNEQLFFFVVYLCNVCVLVLGSGANMRPHKQKKGNENNDLLNIK